MNRIVFLLLLFSALTIKAQQHTVDSLKKLIITSKVDTTKVLAMGALGKFYYYSKPDTAIFFALRGITLSKKIDYLKGQAINLNVEGTALYNGRDYPAAMKIIVKALKLAEQIHNNEEIVASLLAFGDIADAQGDEEQSINYTMQTKTISVTMHDGKMIERANINLGDSYEKLNKLDSARYYTEQSYEQALKLKDFYIMGEACNNLGNIYSKMNDIDIALAYYRKGIPLLVKANLVQGVAESAIGIAKLFKRMNQNDSCLYYARLSMVTAERGDLKSYILGASKFLNDYFDGKGQIDSAYHYQKIAVQTNENLFSQEKTKEVQNQVFEENQREQEMAEQKVAAEEQSRKNLQLAAIAVFIPSFFLFVLLLSRRKAKPRAVGFLVILALLMFFEFITLLLHPYIEKFTNDTPAYSLLILVAIAALIVPLHHKAEHWIKSKLLHGDNSKHQAGDPLLR